MPLVPHSAPLLNRSIPPHSQPYPQPLPGYMGRKEHLGWRAYFHQTMESSASSRD